MVLHQKLGNFRILSTKPLIIFVLKNNQIFVSHIWFSFFVVQPSSQPCEVSRCAFTSAVAAKPSLSSGLTALIVDLRPACLDDRGACRRVPWRTHPLWTCESEYK